MPLSVAVHKGIGEYQEKVVGKLSRRTLPCATRGPATSVATASARYAALGVEPADASLPVMCASLPFWLLGFWRPHGMRAEEFAPMLWEHATWDGVLAYGTSCTLAAPPEPIAQRTTRGHRRNAGREGAAPRGPRRGAGG